MAKTSNWRGCSDIKMKYYNDWADPDLIAEIDGKTYTFNYWDIEDALWDMFLEYNDLTERDTYDARGNISAEYEDMFNEFCQSEAYAYLEDVVYGGYFDGIEDEDGGNWHSRYEGCYPKKKSKKSKKVLNQGCYGKKSAKKESYYRSYTQKQIKDYVRDGLAIDVTNYGFTQMNDLLHSIDKEIVGVSRGTYGVNGVLFKDAATGQFYAVCARNTASQMVI
jgi:hypothetical protein